MRRILLTTLALTPLLAADHEPAKRLNEAASVFSEVMSAPDKGIPQELLENAHCIVIVPALKTAAFVFGAKYGKGYLSCQSKASAGWSAPGTVRIEGGSVGFQIGGSETDLIMLVMNDSGENKLISSKFTLGAEGSVDPWDVRPRLRLMPSFTLKSSRGRARRGCLPDSLWKEPRCGRTSTITPRYMAKDWKTGGSLRKGSVRPKQLSN
jgi:hypothetical protein